MLDYLGEENGAKRIKNAIKEVLAEGYRTKDIANFDAKEVVTTEEMGSLIAEHAAK